jgi:hypothetical protein
MFVRSATELSATANAPKGTPAFTFTLQDGVWNMELPVSPSSLLITKIPIQPGGDEDWLQLLAGRRSSITLFLDTEPFEGAGVLVLEELCTGPEGGAFYRMEFYGGRFINKRIWVCDVSLCIFGDLPPRIFFRKKRKGA